MRSTSDLIRRAIRVAIVRRDTTQTALAKTIGRSDAWLSTRIGGSVPIDLDDLDLIAVGLGMTDGGDLITASMAERDALDEKAAS